METRHEGVGSTGQLPHQPRAHGNHLAEPGAHRKPLVALADHFARWHPMHSLHPETSSIGSCNILPNLPQIGLGGFHRDKGIMERRAAADLVRDILLQKAVGQSFLEASRGKLGFMAESMEHEHRFGMNEVGDEGADKPAP